MKAIVTGSFDPVTTGHLDLIKRAARIFDEVYAVVFVNPQKDYFFPIGKRTEMLRLACAELENVTVDSSSGFVADYCISHGISVIVRGIRNVRDLDYETEMAAVNRVLGGGLETVFLSARKEFADVSSSAVRQKLYAGEKSADSPWSK
ncbi:MAG: pantetheine-phosphate adenylyltransferase [Clostridia bacterium]|nr:pantetheine-phosphate adenylyltransferase [Clostridia bacterium]